MTDVITHKAEFAKAIIKRVVRDLNITEAEVREACRVPYDEPTDDNADMWLSRLLNIEMQFLPEPREPVELEGFGTYVTEELLLREDDAFVAFSITEGVYDSPEYYIIRGSYSSYDGLNLDYAQVARVAPVIRPVRLWEETS